MTREVQSYALAGGLDTSSAALMAPPGALIFGVNYEPLAEGYGRVKGFERFDGRTAPSERLHWMIPFHLGGADIEIGETITGAVSGATGLVLDVVIASGDVTSGTAKGSIALVDMVGEFEQNELLLIAGVDVAVVYIEPIERGAPNDEKYSEWRLATMAEQRALVGAVPGSGPVRGVAVHNGEVYAWRDSEDGTRATGYRATPAGWLALGQVFRVTMALNSVARELLEGDLVVGATSGATAKVLRIAFKEGSWAAGTAKADIYLVDVVGTFVVEWLNVAGLNVASVSGFIAVTFPPGGRYRCISHNFYGAANRFRLYGATGIGPAFELVGNAMVPIATGMPDDKPQRIFEIGNHLGLTFAGGSVQISATGDPLNWTVILGAGEFGLGTEVTDVIQANDTAVALFGAQKIATLTGHDVNDFLLEVLTEEAGAEPDTAQRIAKTVYVDRRGLRSLDATQAYGNFKAGALSQRFEKVFKAKAKLLTVPVGSIVSRSKSQYRLFWSDGTGLSVYMGGEKPEAIPFDLGFTPTCLGSGEIPDGEGLFAGTEAGWVYRLDSGDSFDGEPITAAAMTAFNHFGSPIVEKRYHKISLELQGPSLANIGLTAQFDYGDPEVPIDDGQNFFVRGGGGFWDQSNWDAFAWSDPLEGSAHCPIDGLGRNACFAFMTTAGLIEEPHILQAYIVHFSPQKVKR